MKNLTDPIVRAIRTFAQLIAGGALTGLVSLFTGGLTAQQATLVLAVWTVVVTYVQNLLEDTGAIPSTKG